MLMISMIVQIDRDNMRQIWFPGTATGACMQTSIIKPELHHTSKAIFCNTLMTSMHADDTTSMRSNLRGDVFDVVCYTASASMVLLSHRCCQWLGPNVPTGTHVEIWSFAIDRQAGVQSKVR